LTNQVDSYKVIRCVIMLSLKSNVNKSVSKYRLLKK